MVNDIITFGGGSKRQKDPNGFLHVDDCVLTKAVVNEYMGREIPKWDELGLNPDKIYRVLRDPEAIESSLEQMNGLPILDDHDERHDAETPQQHKRIGCIGTDGAFDGKEVRNRLTFWNKRDIDAIESGAKVALSMGYDYEPVMKSGKHDGEAYDLKMADIVWNHIAHVEKGRVDGAVVADASGLAGMVRRAFDKAMGGSAFKEDDHPRRDDGKLGEGSGEAEKGEGESSSGGESEALNQKRSEVKNALEKIANGSPEETISNLRNDLDQYGGTNDVTIAAGDKNKGLIHIAARHGEEVIPGVLETVVDGKVLRAPEVYGVVHKVTLTKGDYEAVLSLNEDGKKKTWLLTGFNTTVPKGQKMGKASDEGGKFSPRHAPTQTGPMFSRPGLGADASLIDSIRRIISKSTGDSAFTGNKKGAAMSKIDKRIAPNHPATKDKIKNHLRAGAKDSTDTKGNNMTKNKRTGDEEPEETAENRVIAGIKALAAEFDNVHKENGIDPGITDEETSTLKKVQDFLDSFQNQGRDAEAAGTTADPMDEDPESMDEFPPKKKEGEEEADPKEAEDEEPPIHNAGGKYEDAEKGKSPTGDKAMDADAILAQVRREFRMKEQALDEVAPLVGSVQKARAMDSALDVYRFALATHGVEIPKAANLSGLRGMVNMLKRSMQPAVRTGDSFKPTGAEAKIADLIGKSPFAPRE